MKVLIINTKYIIENTNGFFEEISEYEKKENFLMKYIKIIIEQENMVLTFEDNNV